MKSVCLFDAVMLVYDVMTSVSMFFFSPNILTSTSYVGAGPKICCQNVDILA